jgi:hypothetical protein
MGKKSRDKGAAFERECCKVLRAYWTDVRRNLDQYQKKDGKDLSGTPSFVFQCKRRNKTAKWEILLGLCEAEAETTIENPFGACLWRDDYTTPEEDIIITMRLKPLIEFLCLMEDGEL